MKLKTASRGVKARVGHDSHVSKEYGLAKIFQASSAVALGQGIFSTIFFPERHKYLNFCKAILVFFSFHSILFTHGYPVNRRRLLFRWPCIKS